MYFVLSCASLDLYIGFCHAIIKCTAVFSLRICLSESFTPASVLVPGKNG
jgi:hypothetical protein